MRHGATWAPQTQGTRSLLTGKQRGGAAGAARVVWVARVAWATWLAWATRVVWAALEVWAPRIAWEVWAAVVCQRQGVYTGAIACQVGGGAGRGCNLQGLLGVIKSRGLDRHEIATRLLEELAVKSSALERGHERARLGKLGLHLEKEGCSAGKRQG